MRLIKERLKNCYESIKRKSCYDCVKAGLGLHKYIYGAGELESELESYKMRAGKGELEKASWKASWKKSSWKFNI